MLSREPTYCKEFLKYFYFKDFKRTSRNQGNNYYVRVDNTEQKTHRCNIVVAPKGKSLRLAARFHDASTGLIKHEEIFINFRTGIISKTFSIVGERLVSPYKHLTFDIPSSEEDHFQYSLVQTNLYLPEWDDIVQIRELFDVLSVDCKEWADLMFERAKERETKSKKLYEKYLHQMRSQRNKHVYQN